MPTLELLTLLLTVPGALAALDDLRISRQLVSQRAYRRRKTELEVTLHLRLRVTRLL